MKIHDHADSATGQPLCVDCYDYTGHLVWQWWAPELWRRFTITLRRQLAQHLQLTETAAGQLVRVQFAKVAEYQRRGVIHFHALIRLDGLATDTDPYPAPSADVDSDILADLIRTAADHVCYLAPAIDAHDQPRRLRFGAQLDARPVTGAADRDTHGGQLHPETVAAYIAKYTTKAAADLPTDHNGGNHHLRRLQATSRQLASRAAFTALTGGEEPYRGWGRWVDMLGFRGHLATKSRRYSTTLGRLRQARRDYARHTRTPHHETPTGWVDQDQDLDETTLVVGSWRFAGMGWLTSGDVALAAASAARARDD